jgi:MFS family permease
MAGGSFCSATLLLIILAAAMVRPTAWDYVRVEAGSPPPPTQPNPTQPNPTQPTHSPTGLQENTLTLTTFSVESLAAHRITGDAGVSTLPTTARLFGATVAAAPASFLMGRAGRRAGFAVGAVLAVAGALVCAAAVQLRSFPLLLAGSIMGGAEGGFGGFLRFAASEVVPPPLRARAISWTIAASVAAAVLGPHYAQLTRGALPTEFVGTYLAVAALAALYTVVVAANVGLPGPAPKQQDPLSPQLQLETQPLLPAGRRRRTACELLREPGFVVALMAQVAPFWGAARRAPPA